MATKKAAKPKAVKTSKASVKPAARAGAKPVKKKPATRPAAKAKPAAGKATVKTQKKPVPKKAASKAKAVPAKKPAAKKPAIAKPVAKAKTPAIRKAPPKPAPKASTTKREVSKTTSMSSTTATSAAGKHNAAASQTKTAKPQKKAPAKPAGAGLSPNNKTFAPYEIKKGEEYMNEQQKDHFKRILLNWRNELMQEVDRTVHHMQDEAANPPDPADRATLEEEFSIELRTRDRERRLIKKIDSTIELIANDDYGYCDSCGVEIGIRRLEARPTANKCIDCKTLDEIKEKQLGSP